MRPAAVTWLAVAVILQCLIALLTVREVVFPSVILVGGLVTALIRRRAELGRPSTAALLLTILFVIKLYLAPWQPTDVRTFLAFPMAHAASQAMLTWQLAALVSRDRTWLQYVPLVGALTCICLADVELSRPDRALFLWLFLGFLVACACSFHSSLARRGQTRSGLVPRLVLESATLVAVCGIVLVIVPLVSRYWRHFEQFLNERMMSGQLGGQVGFSLISQLGQVVRLRETGGMEIVVRVTAREQPGHLRGAVYDRYMVGGSWRSELPWNSLSPLEDRPIDPVSGEYRFELVPGGGGQQGDELNVYPEAKTFGRLLAPLDTRRVLISLDQIQRDSAGVLALLPGDSGYVPYRLFRDSRNEAGTSTSTVTALESPHNADHVSSRIREGLELILDEALGPAPRRTGMPVRDALDRLNGWLQARFVYSLSVDPIPGTDPVMHFLEVTRAGHCELFASATVLLLRAQGIPARYVTGLLTTEWNPRIGYWVGRQRNAHAWAEVWVPGEGWVTFDTTPESGQPDKTPPSFWSREWEALQWFLQQARAALSEDPFVGIRLIARAVFQTWPGFLVTFSLITWLVTRVFWPALSSWRSRKMVTQDQARQLLERALAGPAAKQLVRGAGETLEAFAQRLSNAETGRWEPLAAWVRRYAGIRYTGKVSAAELGQLRDELEPLLKR